jgi:hypothetical protein
MPVEWQLYRKAAPGERAVGPTAALAGLESSSASALMRHQHIDVRLLPPAASPPTTDAILSRAQRAHSRFLWAKRLARNARSTATGHVTIRLFGILEGFTTFLALPIA